MTLAPRRSLAAVVAVLLSSTTATVAEAVEGGREDSVTTHAVAIATGGPANPQHRCTGTLISPNVVLTVRHCITRLPVDGTSCDKVFPSPSGVPSDVWVDARPWVLPSTTWKNVASWVLPEPTALCGNDIALLVLKTPFAASEATPARPVLSVSEFEKAVLARVFGLAGFGVSSPANTDAGTRRSRFDVPVRCVPGLAGFTCDGVLDYIDVRELTGGAGPCQGDSGAGAIVASDRNAIFGVLSRGDLSRGTCAEGVFERTDVWRWLIAKTALEATPAGLDPPGWARAVFPEAPREGELCLGSGTCGAFAECVSLDGQRSFVCAKRCSAGCGAGLRCQGEVCVLDEGAPPKGDGCSFAPRPARTLHDPLEGIFAVEIALLLAVGRGFWRGGRGRSRGRNGDRRGSG